jgi:ribonuclease HI
MLEVWTDGACSGTPGPGGWGWLTKDGRQDSGFDPSTTNQRMEMMAALKAIMALRDEPGLVIVSDSAYVVNCFKDRWYVGWMNNGWRSSKGGAVANRDLWEMLVPLVLELGVAFRKTSGHSTDEWNNKVDKLCVAAKKAGQGIVETPKRTRKKVTKIEPWLTVIIRAAVGQAPMNLTDVDCPDEVRAEVKRILMEG